MTVLYFAAARQAAGCSREEWPVAEIAGADAFWREATTRHPALAALQAECRLAVNREFAADGRAFSAGDEIAVIPPVSGG